MPSSKKNYLAVGELLRSDDYLVSENALFFAIQQSDGNLAVYRGSGPGDNHGLLWNAGRTGGGGQFFTGVQPDGNFCVYRGTGPGDNKGLVWGTQKTAAGGKFYAVIQDDGNLCVYKGTDPGNQGEFVWGTQVVDPVASVELTSLDYNVNAAKIVQSGPAELYRQTVKNETGQAQSSTISGSATVTETSGWSNSLAVKVGVSTSFKTGIPVIAEGKVSVSLDVTNTYTWNGSTTVSKSWGFNTPVTVPPRTVLIGLVAATLSTITVPYTHKGTFILRSGTRVPGKVDGTYVGTHSHDLTVTFVQRDPITSAVVTRTEAIAAKASQP